MKSVFASRKFKVLALDAFVSSVLFFGAKYLLPELFLDVKFLIGIIQPAVLLVINGWTQEDVALKSNKE